MLLDLLREALAHDRFKTSLVAPVLRLEVLQLRLMPFRTTRGQRLLAEAGLRLSLRAFRGREPVVFTSLFTPPELLHAMGLVPFGLEAAGAGVASLGLAPQALAAAERAWAPGDSCSILRAGLGAAQLGLLPRPRAVVSTSALCDATAKAFASAARCYGVPFCLLDVPYAETPEGVAYLAGQLAALARDLEAVAGQSLDPARLATALELSNGARRQLEGIDAVRRRYPEVLSPGDAQAFLYPTNLLLGSADGAAVFGAFHAELAAAGPRRPAGRGGPRLLVLHVLPYYRHRILAALQEAGALVVYEEMSQVYWPEMDPGRPFESLARRCIAHFDNGPQARRVEATLKLVREFGIDGAVHLSQHGCRQSWGALAVVREALAGVGVPLLELEGDCVDARESCEGQQQTRLAAFVEALGPGRKAPGARRDGVG